MKRHVLAIVGPTAVGKTEYAIRIAKELEGEILSADSMQIYRYMDIGSAKPSPTELALIPHHLVGTVDPRTPWSVADYQKAAKACINDIFKRGKLPIISGGTGLYVNSLLYDMDFTNSSRSLDLRKRLEQEALENGPESVHRYLESIHPEAADRIHPNNLKKVIRAIEVKEESGKGIPAFHQSFTKTNEYQWTLIGLSRNRDQLYERINQRVVQLMESGLIKEVENLLSMGLTKDDSSMLGIGYKEIIDYLAGAYSKQQAIELIQKNSRNYAKRQLTWFRRYEEIQWFDLTQLEIQRNSFNEIKNYLLTTGFGSDVKGRE